MLAYIKLKPMTYINQIYECSCANIYTYNIRLDGDNKHVIINILFLYKKYIY